MRDLEDDLKNDREYNSNKPTIDSRREIEDYREWKAAQKQRPTNELSTQEKAVRYAEKATQHTGKYVDAVEIYSEME